MRARRSRSRPARLHRGGPTLHARRAVRRGADPLRGPYMRGRADRDGDGHDSMACGGDDCDDNEPNRYPGNAEVCDDEGRGEGCNVTTLASVDDGDADGDGEIARRCCHGASCGSDCDDGDRSIHTGARELCNARDDDCDGGIDESESEPICPGGTCVGGRCNLPAWTAYWEDEARFGAAGPSEVAVASDAFVAAYEPDGAYAWVRTLGSPRRRPRVQARPRIGNRPPLRIRPHRARWRRRSRRRPSSSWRLHRGIRSQRHVSVGSRASFHREHCCNTGRRERCRVLRRRLRLRWPPSECDSADGLSGQLRNGWKLSMGSPHRGRRSNSYSRAGPWREPPGCNGIVRGRRRLR